jgi:RNA polymerase sigma-70 factor (ECF subfamily)
MALDGAGDEELIAAIQGRDVRALELLYDRHRVLAYSLALRSLGNPADAEDVVQEAFLNVWRAAGTFRRDRSTPRSWILSIVHHRAIDKLRGRKSRVQPVALEEGMNVPDSADVWRDVAGKLDSDDVRQALRELPAEQRQTIELAYFEGYTHVQISELMDVPLGTVKGRMRIGLHKLKSLLEGSTPEMAIE